jgi:hypothetical protein
MNAPLDQSNEHIRWWPLVLLGAASLIVFALASLAAVLVEADELGGVTDDPTIARTIVGAEQIGMVEPRMIELEDRAVRLAAERKTQLEEYGWVDRERGIIRIPVERAMQDLAEGRR